MFKIFRNRLSAAIIVAFTVAACCSPSEPKSSCDGPSEEAMAEPAAGMGTDPMGMAEETPPCSLFLLAKNDPVPPLYSDIGSAHWYVPVAQDYFDQGLRFFFAFNGREAYRAFHEAANAADRNNVPCAACHWAQALVLGVDINQSKQSPEDRDEANAELQRATNANPNSEDRAIIDALSARYKYCGGSDEKQCQTDRTEGYYNGMKKVLDEFGSDDSNVITLYADSAMNLAPWRYWDNHGQLVTKWSAQLTDAQKYLEKALGFRQYRQNEGPIHWYIHLMEGSTTPTLAKQYAALLAPPTPLAPSAGHLVHMPSHIYYRIGDMQDAITANMAAIKADDAYFAKEPKLYRPDGDRYRYEYYPHNIHFLLAAAVLSGDTAARDIDRYAEKLLQALPDKGNGLRADTYRTVYYLAKLNFATTADIRNYAKPDPFTQQPTATLAYYFAQTMADIWDGKQPAQSADQFNDYLGKMRDAARKTEKNAENPNCDPRAPRLPSDKGLCLASILDDLKRARMAVLDAQRGDSAKWGVAHDAAADAVAVEEALDYYEPPKWLYPARQTLASVLIREADAVGPASWQPYLDEAKRLLRESLNEQNEPPDANRPIPVGTYPGNGWAYYGLLEIANRYDPAGVSKATLDLKTHWFGDPGFHTLDRM